MQELIQLLKKESKDSSEARLLTLNREENRILQEALQEAEERYSLLSKIFIENFEKENNPEPSGM